jgi:hypothetical protein
MLAAVVVALLQGGCPRPVASSGTTTAHPAAHPAATANATATTTAATTDHAPAFFSDPAPDPAGVVPRRPVLTTTATTNNTRQFAPVCFCAIPEFRAQCLAHALAACADAANATVHLAAGAYTRSDFSST